MPVRTCIACRIKGEPARFFRMVAGPDKKVYAELDSRLPGRGAYCCIGSDCLDKALQPKNLTRSLRTSVVVPETGELARTLLGLLKKRVEGLLGAAWRKNVVAAGRDAALRAARSAKEGRLFLAEDLSEGSRSEVAGGGAAPAANLRLSMADIGGAFGRRPVGVIFVADRSLADSLEMRNDQIHSLGVSEICPGN